MKPMLTEEELQRYGRHLLLPGFGVEGQLRLRRSSVLVVGLGRQGLAASLYLAAAGVGRLGLADPEGGGNFARMPCPGWGAGVLGEGRVPQQLRALNPSVKVDQHVGADMADLVSRYDVVVGCVGSARWRQELNRLCLAGGKPLVGAMVLGWEGQLLAVMPGKGPCWNCAFPHDSEGFLAGELGTLVAGAMGILQATVAIKILLDLGEQLSGRYLSFDGMTGRFRQVECRVDPGCPYCSGQKGE